MFSMKKVLPVIAGALCALPFFASADEPMEKVLIAGDKNYCGYYSNMLKKQFACTVIDKDNGEKDWKKKGYILPKFEELKQYKMIILSQFCTTLDVNRQDLIDYVKNGGTIYSSYQSGIFSMTRSQLKEPGYGIAGFKKYTGVCLTPYPKSGHMTHNLVYTKEMKKTREFQFKTLYAVYAGELTDAVPLVVNPEKKDLALACVAKCGKGQLIYNGSTDESELFFDILKACGVIK